MTERRKEAVEMFALGAISAHQLLDEIKVTDLEEAFRYVVRYITKYTRDQEALLKREVLSRIGGASLIRDYKTVEDSVKHGGNLVIPYAKIRRTH